MTLDDMYRKLTLEDRQRLRGIRRGLFEWMKEHHPAIFAQWPTEDLADAGVLFDDSAGADTPTIGQKESGR